MPSNMTAGDMTMPDERETRAAADAAMPDDEFRLRVREWIAENYVLGRNLRNRPKFAYANPWYVKPSERGWLAPGWPAEHGASRLSTLHEGSMSPAVERFTSPPPPPPC